MVVVVSVAVVADVVVVVAEVGAVAVEVEVLHALWTCATVTHVAVPITMRLLLDEVKWSKS